MSNPKSLATLGRLRRRQLDQARAALAAAAAALARFEAERKAWRFAADDEARLADAEGTALLLVDWLDGARQRERQGEVRARSLRDAVAAASRAHHAAELGFAQVEELERRARLLRREAQLGRDQRQLDDLGRRSGSPLAQDGRSAGR